MAMGMWLWDLEIDELCITKNDVEWDGEHVSWSGALR